MASGVLDGTPATPHAEAILTNFGGQQQLQIDVNGDGVIGSGDITVILNGLVGTLSDANFAVIDAPPVITVSAAAPTFTTLDYPGGFDTEAFGINNLGQIVGGFALDPSDAEWSGWSYNGATFTTIIAPNTHDAPYTVAFAINDNGVIAGDYSPSFDLFGFTDANGIFTPIVSDSPSTTTADGINNAGVVVGSAFQHGGTDYSAYIYDPVHGNFTYFSVPAANSIFGQTWAAGINNEGQIVGGYNIDPDFNTDQGYLYDQVHGTFTTIDDPNGIGGTEVQGINDLGQIVGYYYGADGLSHGFVDNGGIFTTIDNPLGVNGTFVTGINNSDQVVGYYTGADGFNHAFETSFNASSATENTPLVLTKLHVSDPGAGNNPIQVTLAVAHGTLALNDATGLSASFDAGRDTLTVTGTVTAIDAALLKGVVYTPGSGFIGDDTLTVTANDQGHNSSGVPLSTTQTVDIPVIQQANEFITGGGGNDIITGGGGNDTLTGGAGSDNFIFNPNFGKDSITDFTPGTDSISVDHTVFANVAALLAAAQTSGQDVVITADLNDTITLKNVSLAQLTAHQGDFHIT